MVFSSTIFIFAFLPFVLFGYYFVGARLKNFFLLISSLAFYAWGENDLVFLMIGSICINYFLGNLITSTLTKRNYYLAKILLSLGLSTNILILGYFKYASFFQANFSVIGINSPYDFSNVVLPIGISFFTFQSMSYLVDVYRGDVKGDANIIDVGMYIALFPQLVAGPIVRYTDISVEIKKRIHTQTLFKTGIIRFITGLAKKVIIANNVGLIADAVFEISPSNLSTPLAWIGIICYALQIYFDFSGYSDMAIGLGKMFGFNFKENFNHPYIALSIKDFWRRWHISLSTWFRDYLYIPLGGNRRGETRTYFNLTVVFLLTGFWHGASWNFIIWGLFHGSFLIIERLKIFSLKLNSIFARVYVLIVVLIGWVFFRSESVFSSFGYLKCMFFYSKGQDNYPWLLIDQYSILIIIVGIILSMPVRIYIKNYLISLFGTKHSLNTVVAYLFYLAIFFFSILELSMSNYNPFIYFRF